MFFLTTNISSMLMGILGGKVGYSLAALMGFFTILLVIGIIIYVYKAWAWFTIGRKLKNKVAWLSWIPVVQFFLLPILAGWNWLWGFIILLPVIFSLIVPIKFLGGVLLFISLVFLAVMSIIWTWKIYRKRRFPGWLSLIPILYIIPIVNIIAGIAQLVIIGLVAWLKK